MIIYELLIDYDGTTRSSHESQGLFFTEQKAEKEFKRLALINRVFGGYTIRKRQVM